MADGSLGEEGRSSGRAWVNGSDLVLWCICMLGARGRGSRLPLLTVEIRVYGMGVNIALDSYSLHRG